MFKKEYSEYIKNFYNIRKQPTNFLNGQKIWTNASQKNTNKWPIIIWKSAHHH